MSKKPSNPKGMRDFSPEVMRKRNYITKVISENFKKFGFQAIETPAMENLSTLMGKYGEEGDKLLFKVINSGDFLKKINKEDLSEGQTSKVLTQISEKGLKYDLTVPFARYVVQNQNDISFPFKRYQIQPVWRADRPQKGRFREFYQCDADVVGSKSLWQEVEFIQLYDTVFSELGIPITVKVNNRKILSGIAEVTKITDVVGFTVALDKLDKIGQDKVEEEWSRLGIDQEQIKSLSFLFNKNIDIEKLKSFISSSTIGVEGVSELEFLLNTSKDLGVKNEVCFDITLARGLNYYTGAIYEVKANDVSIGSIGGGGRYDDLTGIFGLKDVSGVGISFGLDRIYLVLEELNKFPVFDNETVSILFLNFGTTEMTKAMKWVKQCRKSNIKVDIYPDPSKINKQFNYANKMGVPYVAILGEQEAENDILVLKNMQDSNQVEVKSIDEILKFIQ